MRMATATTTATTPATRTAEPSSGARGADRQGRRRGESMGMTGWHLGESYDFHGQAVRYGVIGSGSPMVLVHGTPFSSYVWHRIVPYLVKRHAVHFYDLLGYG